MDGLVQECNVSIVNALLNTEAINNLLLHDIK